MEIFDINKITREIRTKTSIPEKLEYWLKIKTKYIDEPLKKAEGKFLIGHSASYKRLTELFGKDYKVVSSLNIPQHIYNEHFSEGLNEPEFTYWFLKYNAKEYFESIYLGSQLDTKLSSPIAKQHIAADLKELNDFEKNAYDLLLHKTIDIYSSYYNSEHAQEIEFLRIKDKYYVKNILPDVHSVVNTTVELYARHIYLKDFLETKLKGLEAAGTKSQTTSKTVTDYTSQVKNEIAAQSISSKVPDSLSFTKNNYEIEIRDWNKKHNNNLTKWIQNGQIVEVEKWLFVNKDVLLEQKQVLNDLYDLINMTLINLADLHDEIIEICLRYANSIETLLDRFFADSKDMRITIPFSSLCPKIIKQPKYLIEAYLKHPYDLPEHKRTYYRYKYLKNKLGFGEDKFHEYKLNLNSSIRIEISNNNKNLINSMFLFIEQFIDDLKRLHRTRFNYISSPLFRLLFEEVMKFKGYYLAAFGQFTFTNILEIENALKSMDEFESVRLQNMINKKDAHSPYIKETYEVSKALTPVLMDTELSNNEEREVKTAPKYGAKYYALYHWILIEMGKAKPWELNENDKFPKSEIVQYAKSQYFFKDGQGFYRQFIGMNDFNNKVAIVRSINDKNYKKKLIDISNNNADIIHHLKNYPN